jgi:hypothetical protein
MGAKNKIIWMMLKIFVLLLLEATLRGWSPGGWSYV